MPFTIVLENDMLDYSQQRSYHDKKVIYGFDHSKVIDFFFFALELLAMKLHMSLV